MGYVYSLKEWEEGRIATPSGYKSALQQVSDSQLELYQDGLIWGSIVNGSNLHGEGGPGSDIDVVVVTNYIGAENELNKTHNRIMDESHVYVDFVPMERSVALQGGHPVDNFYYNYMKAFCRGNIIGNDPLSVIAPKRSWSDPRQEVESRITANLSKMSKKKASVSPGYDKDHCKLLETVLRQPIYAAIDMLRLKRGRFPAGDGRPLSKAECCEVYKSEFPGMDTDGLFIVLGMRIIYRDFLNQGRGSAAEYKELLEEIEGIYPQAREFMKKNYDYLASHPKP